MRKQQTQSGPTVASLLLLDICEGYNQLIQILEEVVVVVNLDVGAVLLLSYDAARRVVGSADLPVAVVSQLHAVFQPTCTSASRNSTHNKG